MLGRFGYARNCFLDALRISVRPPWHGNGRTTKPAGPPLRLIFCQNPGRRTKDRRLSSQGISYTSFVKNARLNSIPPNRSSSHFRGIFPVFRGEIPAFPRCAVPTPQNGFHLFCMVSCILRNFRWYAVLHFETLCFPFPKNAENAASPPPPRHFLFHTAATVNRRGRSVGKWSEGRFSDHKNRPRDYDY